MSKSCQEVLCCMVDDLDLTEDVEACEEPHGAADEAELGLHRDLHIPLHLGIQEVGGRARDTLIFTSLKVAVSTYV